MSESLRDLRHALRRLVRSPGFTTAAVLTLALGIAANTAIFTVVERVILRPLPYEDADRLIWIDHVAPGLDLPGNLGLSQGLYEYYRTRTRTFESLALFSHEEFTLTGVGEPQRIRGLGATASLMDALRVLPALGRWYSEQEAQDDADVVVLSDALWSAVFGRAPDVIGRTLRLNGTSYEVIGVMPAAFAFPDPTIQLFLPERLNEQQLRTVGGFNYRSIARLRDGVEVGAVKRELDGFIGNLKTDFPDDAVAQQALDAAQLGAMVVLLKDHEVGSVRRTLWILLGMVGMVLLIACANVANLFLVRSEARQREIAVRRALGAGRMGIIRYFLAESALLSAASATIALGLAWGAVRLLVRFGPDTLPRLHEVTLGTASIAWTAVLALGSTFLFGAVPFMRGGSALAPTLRDGGRGSTAGRARFRTRNALMASQVALALVLLIVSGLMVRSFVRLRAVDPGFDAQRVLTFDVRLAVNDYPSRDAASGFHDALLERLGALPGVESAGAVSCLPLTGSCWGDPLLVRGRPLEPGQLPPIAQIRRALPGYFEALRLRPLEGRTLVPADHQQRTNAVVISRTFARVYFPGEQAIGKQVSLMFGSRPGEFSVPPDSAWLTVVGIVEDTPIEELGEASPYPLIYLPALQRMAAGNGVHGMTYTVRTAADPLSVVRAVRAAVGDTDPNVALARVRSLEDVVSQATARMEFTMVLLLIAGGAALLLGAIGIYGVISYVVGQRTGEIGVRMALGARPGDVSRMVLRQSGAVIGVGLLLGLATALALTRLMTTLLFGVTATDPVTYAAVTSFLLAVAALASWLPARRAAALDPTAALRKD